MDSGKPRISVKQGIEAYQRAEVEPCQGTMYRHGHFPQTGETHVVGACAIGALLLAGNLFPTDYTLAYGQPYVIGFMNGFDGYPDKASKVMMQVCQGYAFGGHRYLDDLRFHEGLEDGRALWEAVKDGVPEDAPEETEVRELAYSSS